MKVIAYCRVASGQNAELTLKNQKDKLTRYAADKGYTIVDTIEATESGIASERESIKQLLEKSKGFDIQKVLVVSLDRISRNMAQFLEVEEELKKNGAEVLAINM